MCAHSTWRGIWRVSWPLVGPGVGIIIVAHQVAPLLAAWSFVGIAWQFFLLCGPSTPHLLQALASTHNYRLISALQLCWKSFLSCLLFLLYSYLAHPSRGLGEPQDPSCLHWEGLASGSAVSLSSQTVMSCFQGWRPICSGAQLTWVLSPARLAMGSGSVGFLYRFPFHYSSAEMV